jgi:hypothetical protein
MWHRGYPQLGNFFEATPHFEEKSGKKCNTFQKQIPRIINKCIKS